MPHQLDSTMNRTLVFLVAAAAAFTLRPAPAQSSICHSVSDNTVYDNGTSMGGPNLWLAIRAQAPIALSATRVEIWTGERTGTNSIGLWTHDAVNNRPATNLGTAAWSMSAINAWQGATLSSPVTIPANTTFWVVWAPINSAQASIQTNTGGAMTYRGSFDGGQTWSGPFTSGPIWKFRIYCGGTPGHYEVFGSGCAGATRRTPALGFFGIPTIGRNMSLMLQNGLGGGNAFLVVGISDTFWNGTGLPFDLTGAGAPGCRVLASLEMVVGVPIDPTGETNLTLPIPPNAALVGAPFFDQWFVLDPAANPLQLLVSNGGRGRIGD